MKKMLALTIGFLLVGLAFGLAQEKTQQQAQAQSQTAVKAKGDVQQNKVQAKSEFRHRNRIAFVDENGDGINDLARDADGDGIPNGQDADWVKPQDGTGYQVRNGKDTATATATGAKGGSAYRLKQINKSSFRGGQSAAGRTAGTGVCDGTGPKGTAQRKGRR